MSVIVLMMNYTFVNMAQMSMNYENCNDFTCSVKIDGHLHILNQTMHLFLRLKRYNKFASKLYFSLPPIADTMSVCHLRTGTQHT